MTWRLFYWSFRFIPVLIMDRRGSTIVRTIPKTAIPVFIVNQKHFERYKPILIF